MTMFDLSPLYRSTVGFDRLARMLDDVSSSETPTYPPYNIERLGEDEYRITMAVAGFGPEDISIDVEGNSLAITGKKTNGDGKSDYLHQGIAARAFERRFQLASHVEVKGATLDKGLLHVSLKREVPEALKPRRIAINGGSGPTTLEGRKAA
ncbi:MAG TPA: Hsp20 family protein [Aestuariivirga sp.]|nr:Hsp20 family protein [Aestuariivirga sp.]